MLSDSDLVAELLARGVDRGATVLEALGEVLAQAEGAFSMVILESGKIHAVRDPHGFRPLCLGQLGTAEEPEGWVVASQTPVQLLEPASDKQDLCIFEFVYFARPDSYLMGHQVHTSRRRMGELLAGQSHVDADIVMGVPDSGVPAAEGFAKASGIPFGYGLVKNRYIGRTFISPDQVKRAASVRRKLNPLRENIEGQRLVVVDD